MKNIFKIRILLLVVIATLLIAPVLNPKSVCAESPRLKMALLPIADAFPFYVARAKGYFNVENIHITVLPVGSAIERDQLLQAGEVDGVLNEMISVANFNRNKIQAKIAGIARRPAPKSPLFRILTAPASGFKSTADLAGVPIGVSRNTIIEYVTDRMLKVKGLSADKIAKESVPVIPERYQLLLHGQIKAATLPDPLGKSAIEAGAFEILNDTNYPQYSVSVLSFTQNALADKPEAVRTLLKGWYRAAADINAAPDAFRDLFFKNIRVPENIRRTFTVPWFPGPEIPSEEEWLDIMDWMVNKSLLSAPVSYKDSVTEEFLPEK